jgi:hypothetical protein
MMTSETAIREATNVAKTGVRESINLVKKAWSIMDAASEKKSPSDYLSSQTIRNIQGEN